MNVRYFMSESGDRYSIPEAQYDKEVAEYRQAVENGDEDTMLKFEEGWTGWKYVRD